MWLIMCANGTEENIFVAHNYYFTYFHNCKTRDLTHNTAFDIPIWHLIQMYAVIIAISSTAYQACNPD